MQNSTTLVGSKLQCWMGFGFLVLFFFFHFDFNALSHPTPPKVSKLLTLI